MCNVTPLIHVTDIYLVSEDGLVVSFDLKVLGSVILDGLEVEEGVHGAAPLLVVGFVHSAPEFSSPLGDGDRAG